MKRSSRRNRYYTILIIPETESNTKTFQFRRAWLYLFVGIGAIVIGVAAWFVIRNYDYMEKAGQYDKVVAENKQLMETQQRILQLDLKMKQLQHFRSRTISTLSSASLLKTINTPLDLPDTVLRELTANVPVRSFQSSLAAVYASMPSASPVTNPVVSRGFETHLTNKTNHFGIDLAAPTGTPVQAVANGVVIFTDWTADYGYTVMIQHPSGFTSVYKHNRNAMVVPGQQVQRRDIIATVGSTGRMTTGSHCHLELWKGGEPVDPAIYIHELKQ